MTIIQRNDRLYLSQESYFEKVKSQLINDINDLHFEKKIKLISFNQRELLASTVTVYLQKTFTKSSSLFYQLMYKIDIPETTLESKIVNFSIDFSVLSDLVLKRELMKVLTREKYSR